MAGSPTETVIDKDSKSGFGNTKHTFSSDTFEDPAPRCASLDDLNGKWSGYFRFTVSGGTLIEWEGRSVSSAFSAGCPDASSYIAGETGDCGWFNFVVPGWGHVGCCKVSDDGKTMKLMAEPGYIDPEWKQ